MENYRKRNLVVKRPVKRQGVHYENLDLENFFFASDLFFEDCRFQMCKLLRGRIQGALTFINCFFHNEINLTDVHVEKDINLKNVWVFCDVRMFKGECKRIVSISPHGGGAFDLKKVRIEEVKIEKGSLGALTVADDSRLGSLALKEMHIDREVRVFGSTINEITLMKCRISAPIEVLGSDITNSLAVRETSAPRLNIGRTKQPELGIEVSECHFEEGFSLEHLKLQGKNSLYPLSIKTSHAGALDMRNIVLEKVFFDLQDTIVSGGVTIRSSEFIGSVIDLSGSEFEWLNVDREAITFRKFREPVSPYFISDKIDSRYKRQRRDTLIHFRRLYRNDKNYRSEDNCFYWLRTYDLQSKVTQQRNVIAKFFIAVYYWLGRLMLGWGVRLTNVLFAMGASVLAFSLIIYTFGTIGLLDQYEVGKVTFNVDSYANSMFLSIIIFFSVFGEGNPTPLTPPVQWLVVTEHLIGLCYLTLVVGIILRKLIR